MDAAESIATTSIRAADAGLGVAGVEDGQLWLLGGGALLGPEAAEAISQIVSMVLRFSKDIDIDVLELQRGIRTLALLQHSAPAPMTPPPRAPPPMPRTATDSLSLAPQAVCKGPEHAPCGPCAEARVMKDHGQACSLRHA